MKTHAGYGRSAGSNYIGYVPQLMKAVPVFSATVPTPRADAKAAVAANNANCRACHTCHKSTLAKVQAAINSTATDKSNLKCEACHTGTADGVPAVHADIVQPHLIGIFPLASDAECLNCHPTSTYGGGGSGNSGFSSGSTNYHNIGDHVVNNVVQCSWCHAAVPHGTDKANLVVTSNELNSTGNVLTNFYHPASGQHQKSSCGSNTSACSEHSGY